MKKILVVDDDRSIRMLYSDELSDEGYQVTIDDGSGVVEIISQGRPDLVILDLRLKGSNGLDLLQEIRSRFKVPVIVSTAYPDPGNLDAESFVEKSSDLSPLKREVKRLLTETASPAIAPAAGPSWALEPAVSLLPMAVPQTDVSKPRI